MSRKSNGKKKTCPFLSDPQLAAELDYKNPDLLKRYVAISSHVWKIRKDLDPPQRLPHEAQFLPAALELQETPVSPAPRIVAWLLMAFALIAVLWAVFGRIDVVATAQGKIVPNEGSKLVQRRMSSCSSTASGSGGTSLVMKPIWNESCA